MAKCTVCGSELERSESTQENWSTATRLVAAGTGFWLMANCLERRTFDAALLGTLGFGLCLRALTNMGTKRLWDEAFTRARSYLESGSQVRGAAEQAVPETEHRRACGAVAT